MKVAIIGCGGLGQVHADCYARIPGVTVAAVCDIDEAQANRVAASVDAAVYTSFDDMLAQADFELISITLPTYLHKEFTVRAAAAGKHVLCEKPIALNSQDAEAMIAACEANGVRLFIGQVVRFFPEYAQMKARVEEGALGTIGTVHCRRVGGHPGHARDWYFDEAKSGGVIADLMIHDIDFVRWTLGEVKSVYALRRTNRDQDYAHATLVFENGAVAALESHWGYPGSFRTAAEIAGSTGILRADSMKSSSLTVMKSGDGGEAGRRVEVPQSPSFQNPYEQEIAHFIDCIRTGREAIVTARDAAKALEIARAAVESAQSGKAVFIGQRQSEEESSHA